MLASECHRGQDELELERLKDCSGLRRSTSLPTRLARRGEGLQPLDKAAEISQRRNISGRTQGCQTNVSALGHPKSRTLTLRPCNEAISNLIGPPLAWILGATTALLSLYLACQANTLSIQANKQGTIQTQLSIWNASLAFKQDCEARQAHLAHLAHMSSIHSSAPEDNDLSQACSTALAWSVPPPPFSHIGKISTNWSKVHETDPSGVVNYYEDSVLHGNRSSSLEVPKYHGWLLLSGVVVSMVS